MGRPGRTTSDWGRSTTSEDSELSSSLTTARNRSRALVRDAAYAKRAKVIVQNNVIGSGIGMQARVMTSRDELNDRINDDIEAQWEKWSCGEYCHTGGALHFGDLERVCMGQVFETGEVFIRKHYQRFRNSAVPFALEVIEPERIADQYQPSPGIAQNIVRLGIELDSFGAPVAYFIRTIHPGDYSFHFNTADKIERVPAEEIIHLRIIERWPQTRAIPWLHAAARKLNDMDGLTEAEITAARAAACYMGFIESPDGETSYGETQPDGSKVAELEPATVEHLAPGEKFTYAAPNRPNSQLDPFMRMMLREVAAGSGCSYESLSRDYSQSNYSSSRLALLDDRDLWRMLQIWFCRNFRTVIHKEWVRMAVVARAVKAVPLDEYALHPEKFEAVQFKPRGWSWIDPTSEVDAYKEAIKAGFTTVTHVIAQTGDGRDLEDVMKERQMELKWMKEWGLKFDTDPSLLADPNKQQPAAQPKPEPDDEDEEEDGDNPTVEEAEKMLRAITKVIHKRGLYA